MALGRWALGLFISSLTHFLKWTQGKRLGDTSNPVQESEKATNQVSILVLVDLIIGPKC